ncbi:hypothetical protein chiPu_0028266, partial [Chiloscyllium punctatum]|nr:hypothetical protein [Chiloscyllium punctatum]
MADGERPHRSRQFQGPGVRERRPGLSFTKMAAAAARRTPAARRSNAE